MSNIRLTYSGLISFILLLVSIITGLIFTLIVTRRLDPTEFGLWSLIGGIIAYSLIFSPVSNYWVRRHIARDEEESVTGIIAGIFFAIGGVIVYFLSTYVISEFSDTNYQILVLAAVLIPLSYIIRSFNSIASGFRPQISAYSMLVFELTKIPLGFGLVYLLDMGLEGAILTAIISHLAQIGYFSLSLKVKLKEKFHLQTFKHWVKLSWLPVVSTLHDRIIHLDSTVFTLITGSVMGVAYVGVARVIGNFVSNSSSISVGLTPKLIATQNVDHIRLMLDRTLLFAIPMLGFSIIFAKPGLWILNPVYSDAISIVYLWSIIHFTWVIYGIFTSTLQGLERIDVGFKADTKEYLKSKLFSVPLVFVIGYSIYLVSLTIVFWQANSLNLEILDIVFWWGMVGVICNVAILITFWIMASKRASFNFPIKKVSKYILLTLIASSIVFVLLTYNLTYEEEIMIFGPSLIPYILLFVGIYFGILLSVDRDSRIILKQVVKEIKK